MFSFLLRATVLTSALMLSLSACGESPHSDPHSGLKAVGSRLDSAEPSISDVLTVYKSPTCGCCQRWVEHLQGGGFQVNVRNTEEMQRIKLEHGVPTGLASCHTAVSTQGYVFEGHIPLRYVEQFLVNPPEGAIGLAVPGMPAGSPGMEMGGRTTSYQVLLIMLDGSTEVFATVDAAQPQEELGDAM
jgi:hypothetical protein